MTTKTLSATILDNEAVVEYDSSTAGYALLALRVVMGWTLFYAGVTKLLAGDWTAEGYLLHAIPEGNPFASLWPMFADLSFIISPLVMLGLTLTGLGLILGAAVRWNAFWAAVMMMFFWASSLPLENGIIVDSHFVYALLLFTLGAFGVGRLAGLDAIVETKPIVQRNSWLTYLLG